MTIAAISRGRWQKPNARGNLGSDGNPEHADPPRSSRPEWTPIVQPALLLAGIGFALQFLMGVFFMAAQGGILWTGLLQRGVVSLTFVAVGLLVLVALHPLARRPFADQIAVALFLTIPAAMLTMALLGELLRPIMTLLHPEPAPPAVSGRAPDNYWIRVGQAAYFFVGWVSAYLAQTYSYRVRAEAFRAAAAELQAMREKTRALRYQLNPHFLFNALNSISALVVKKDPRADDMIANLADLLRESLATDPFDDVSLEREIELASLYFQIEAVRFGDRLKVVVDVPRDLRSAPVPSLILQPLVENAIKYGVAGTDTPVTVCVTASRADGMLTLAVRDDGPGTAAGSGTSIGHRNIRDRLYARFGDAASFTAGPSGVGFEAKVTIPWI